MSNDTTATPRSRRIEVGAGQVHLLNVLLRDDLLLDEVHLEGGDVRIETPETSGGAATLSTGETLFRVVISEPNLNRLIAANLPANAPVRGLQVALLTGKLRITGQYVKLIAVPFSVDATLKITNGLHVSLDLSGVKTGVIGLPTPVVEALEAQLGATLAFDLSRAPFPAQLDSALYEPGRLTLKGRARVTLPAPSLPVPPDAAPVVTRPNAEMPALLSD